MTRRRLRSLLPLLLVVLVAREARPVPPPPATTDPVRDADGGADFRRAAELSKRAVGHIAEGKWAEAEANIEQALQIVPDDPVNLYNLACVRARLGKGEAAVESLERAAAAGFADFGLIAGDPDLESVRLLPRFKKFVAEKDRWQRLAANRLLAGLKAQFGEGKGYVYDLDEEQKIVFAAHLESAALGALNQSLAAQAKGLRRDLFGGEPQAYLRLVVPSPSDYRKIMRLRGVGGAYHPASRTLVAERPGEVIRHEFTHALHHNDRTASGQEHAAWVVEGLGVLYESVGTDAEGAVVPDGRNRRLVVAQAAAHRRSLVPLERLMKMPADELLRRPNLTYAQSGALMLYLYERGVLRTFYDQYKKGLKEDPAGERALVAAAGKKSLGEVEAAFSKWLMDAPPPAEPVRVGGHAAFLGLALGPAEGGLAVTAVAQGGPAESAGVEVGDMVIEVNGKPVPDYAALRPAIGTYSPGRTITLRVLRGEQYLNLPVKLPDSPRPRAAQ